MPNDVVQIGSIIISKAVFDVFTVILSVVIGGMITYLTTRAIENQKWKQQKVDKQKEQYREALALALDWIAPIDTALIQIESLSISFVFNRISRDEFQEGWPNLLHDLSRLDKEIPARLKMLLPMDVYGGLEIVNKIRDLYIYLLKTEPVPKKRNNDLINRSRDTTEKVEFIKKLSEEYKNMLIAEYKNTYK